MDPTNLIPGLGDSLKAHLRPSEEPRDLAYWMVMVLNLAAWVLVAAGAIAAVLYIINNFTDGPVSRDTALDYLLLLIAFPFGFIGARVIMWREYRSLSRRKADLLQHLDIHARLGGAHVYIGITGEDAAAQWPNIRRRIEELWASRQEPEE